MTSGVSSFCYTSAVRLSKLINVASWREAGKGCISDCMNKNCSLNVDADDAVCEEKNKLLPIAMFVLSPENQEKEFPMTYNLVESIFARALCHGFNLVEAPTRSPGMHTGFRINFSKKYPSSPVSHRFANKLLQCARNAQPLLLELLHFVLTALLHPFPLSF